MGDYRGLIAGLERDGRAVSIRAAQAIRALTKGGDKSATFGRLTIYSGSRDPEVDGKPVRLARRRRQYLQAFSLRPHRWLTAGDILCTVYGLGADRTNGLVNATILHLRRDLRGPLGFDCVDTNWGSGYRLSARLLEASGESRSPMPKPASVLPDTVAVCLEICDMYADENIRMAYDTILNDPILSLPARSSLAQTVTREECARSEKLQIEGGIHSAMYHAAKNIGAAIRTHYGLPVRNDI